MKVYDVVILKKDLPEKNLKKGIRGTIVMIYDEPKMTKGYEVEFVDDIGDTIHVMTIQENYIELADC